jgi:hypothetical protein
LLKFCKAKVSKTAIFGSIILIFANETTFTPLFFCLANISFGQPLKPGFDKKEYLQLLYAYSRWGDSAFYSKIPESKIYKKKNRRYRSEEMGLENSWEMYETPTQSVISIRATTNNPTSWMGNFYAAMVPAVGKSNSMIRFVLTTILPTTLKPPYTWAGHSPRVTLCPIFLIR